MDEEGSGGGVSPVTVIKTRCLQQLGSPPGGLKLNSLGVETGLQTGYKGKIVTLSKTNYLSETIEN